MKTKQRTARPVPRAVIPPIRERRVTFEIHTVRPLAVGEQVFIAGSTAMLGDWRPDGFPLTRMDELRWAGTAILPATEDLEYKVTRGSWDTEEVDALGVLPANHRLAADGEATVRHDIAGWRDGA